MKLSIGIVGLPNVGKSTLFNALTKKGVPAENYPFCTIDPSVGIVPVPDSRLEKLAALSKSKKIVPAVVEFVDIAGLVKGASQGEGLGNKFLSHIREVEVIAHVVRAFEDASVVHVYGTPDPARDIDLIKTELELADLETKEKHGAKKEELQLLSKKPVLYIANVWDESDVCARLGVTPCVAVNALTGDGVDGLIQKCYDLLGLMTYFTTGEDETRAWTITKDSTAPEAGAAIHSDFRDKFIRAEVINWKELLETGSYAALREKGLLRTEGRDYIVEDGDVIEFKI